MSGPSHRFEKSLAKDTGYILDGLLGNGSFSTGVHKANVKVAFKQKLRRKMSNEKLDITSKKKETHSIAIKVCALKHTHILEHEHLLLTQLEHANVVKAIGTTRRIGDYGIMMMELVEGIDLYSALDAFFQNKSHVPPLRTVRHIAKSILLGLEYLQQQEVVHNDIKPENILIGAKTIEAIGRSTSIKLCDFGFAVKENESYSACGSPDWCSPEKIFRGVEIFSYASDIFSFGFVMYAVCTGYMAIKLGKSLTKRAYERLWVAFSDRVRLAEHGFFADYEDSKDIVLSTTPVDPAKRITASQALQLRFFA